MNFSPIIFLFFILKSQFSVSAASSATRASGPNHLKEAKITLESLYETLKKILATVPQNEVSAVREELDEKIITIKKISDGISKVTNGVVVSTKISPATTSATASTAATSSRSSDLPLSPSTPSVTTTIQGRSGDAAATLLSLTESIGYKKRSSETVLNNVDILEQRTRELSSNNVKKARVETVNNTGPFILSSYSNNGNQRFLNPTPTFITPKFIGSNIPSATTFQIPSFSKNPLSSTSPSSYDVSTTPTSSSSSLCSLAVASTLNSSDSALLSSLFNMIDSKAPLNNFFEFLAANHSFISENINSADSEGRTLIEAVIKSESLEIVQFLLALPEPISLDVSLCSASYTSLLQIAVNTKSFELVSELFKSRYRNEFAKQINPAVLGASFANNQIFSLLQSISKSM